MSVSLADVTTPHAGRYLQQLCKHWSHKFDVTFDTLCGRIPFSETAKLVLKANGDVLSLQLDAPPDRLPTLEDVVSDHLKRFAFKEDLTIAWQPVG